LFSRPCRLVGRDREREPSGDRPVRGHLLLDTAAFLGAGDEVPRRLRGRQRAHAARGGPGARGGPQDPHLLVSHRRIDPGPRALPAAPRAGARSPTAGGAVAGCSRAGPSGRPARVARLAAPAPAAAGATGRGVDGGPCAGIARPGGNPASMRLFHLSIAYLTLLFAAIAVVSLLPWGHS